MVCHRRQVSHFGLVAFLAAFALLVPSLATATASRAADPAEQADEEDMPPVTLLQRPGMRMVDSMQSEEHETLAEGRHGGNGSSRLASSSPPFRPLRNLPGPNLTFQSVALNGTGPFSLPRIRTIRHNGLVTLETDPSNNMFLQIDITDVMSTPGNEVWLLVTAMYSRGAYLGGMGDRVLHANLEATPDTMIGFQLTSDRLSVDVLQPYNDMRTSDKQSQVAFEQGAYAPWVNSIPRLNVGSTERVTIDGNYLLQSGFFVTSSISGSARLVEVGSFPKNFDITVEYATPGLSTVTYSVALLPRVPMAPRASDPRLGYFDQIYTDKGVHNTLPTEKDSDAIDRTVKNIWRYDIGSLPDQQLKVYVEPSIPKRWRPYVKDGIERWNEAFVPLGFKNDTVRAVLPTDADWPSDYASGDVRFTTIAWCIASSTYAMGVAKVDPRSGQILKGDIIFGDGWVDSYMSQVDQTRYEERLKNGVRREVLKPLRSVDERSSSLDLLRQLPGPMFGLPAKFSLAQQGISAASEDLSPSEVELLGSGVRDVVMHEFGHLLGLRHNFKGSVTLSYECMQSRECAEKNGLSTTVMDYMPMNLPSAGIEGVLPFSRTIGEYDKLAIRYGYQKPPGKAREGSVETRQMLQSVLREAEKFQVCTDEEYQLAEDPLCEQHDMTSEPVRYYRDKLKLYSNALGYLVNSSVLPGAGYDKYGDGVLSVLNSMQTVGSALTYWIGGVNVSHSYRGEDGSSGAAARRPIPAQMQLQALDGILDILQPSVSGLIPVSPGDPFLIATGTRGGIASLDIKGQLLTLQTSLVNATLTSSRLAQVFANQGLTPSLGSEPSMNISAFLRHLTGRVFFGGSNDRSAISHEDVNNWGLQRIVARGLRTAQADENLPAELNAEIAQHMDELRDAAGSALAGLARSPPEKHLMSLRLDLRTTFFEDERSGAMSRSFMPVLAFGILSLLWR